MPAPPRTRKEPRPTKVAQLERRLDDLTSQLEAAQAGTAPFPPQKAKSHYNYAHIFPTEELAPTTLGARHDDEEMESSSGSPSDAPSSTTATSAPPTLGDGSGAHGEGPWPRPSEAAMMLEWYKEAMAPVFPFVVVPPHLSAAELRRQRPILWKAMAMAACFYDGPKQLQLAEALLRDIGQAAFGRPHTKLDLLQGVELLVAW